MLKKIFAFIFLMCMFEISFSGTPMPDHWTFSSENSGDGNVTLIFKLKLDKDWHVYSQHTPDGGPLPMVYKFDALSCYERVGDCVEPAPHEEYDSTFMLKVLIYDKEVTFRQKVKVKNNGCKIKGTIEYQVCKDMCIPRDTSFVFSLNKK